MMHPERNSKNLKRENGIVFSLRPQRLCMQVKKTGTITVPVLYIAG